MYRLDEDYEVEALLPAKESCGLQMGGILDGFEGVDQAWEEAAYAAMDETSVLRQVGIEMVDGARTMHWEIAWDLDAYDARMRERIEEAGEDVPEDSFGEEPISLGTMVLDFWIDDERLLRKVRTSTEDLGSMEAVYSYGNDLQIEIPEGFIEGYPPEDYGYGEAGEPTTTATPSE